MPELPEVETVRRGLDKALRGARIEKVLLRRKDLRIPFPKGLANSLTGTRITSIGRRAKYLIFHLDSGDALIAHLGMTGRFSVEPQKPKALSAHDHVIITLEDRRYLIFNDARRFGLMTLTRSKDLERHQLLAHLGPEPLGEAFSAKYLKQALASRSGPIKPVLMDQALVVGVGNIYASEALFRAGISPRKRARDVTRHTELIEAIHHVLNDAIQSGGSSLRDFLHVTGEVGNFQHHFNVYGRKNQPCFLCHTPIENIQLGGRSTFFCKKCQK